LYSRALTAAWCMSRVVSATCWRMMVMRSTALPRSLQASGWLQHWVLGVGMCLLCYSPHPSPRIFLFIFPETNLFVQNLSHRVTCSRVTLLSSPLTHQSACMGFLHFTREILHRHTSSTSASSSATCRALHERFSSVRSWDTCTTPRICVGFLPCSRGVTATSVCSCPLSTVALRLGLVVHRDGRRSVEHRRLVACIMTRCFGILARRFRQEEVWITQPTRAQHHVCDLPEYTSDAENK